jgi:hypothetical protein
MDQSIFGQFNDLTFTNVIIKMQKLLLSKYKQITYKYLLKKLQFEIFTHVEICKISILC